MTTATSRFWLLLCALVLPAVACSDPAGQLLGGITPSQPVVPACSGVEACIESDGCCPEGCNANTDDDCRAVCNNGTLEDGETCDGQDLDGASCTTQGFGGGTIACAVNCELDLSNCDGCGNGLVDNPGEDCDGSDLDQQTCSSRGFEGGSLACTRSCRFDTAGCFECGDGTRNGDEACDGQDFGATSCSDIEGFDGGQLGCTGQCAFDTSQCTKCGDGARDPGEDCDDDDLGGATCADQGLGDGLLSCTASCRFDTTGCSEACSASLSIGSLVAVDANPAPNVVFVNSAEISVRMANTAEVTEVRFQVEAQPSIAEALGCTALTPGFNCSLNPSNGSFRVFATGAAVIPPSPNPVSFVRLEYQVQTSTNNPVVLVLLTPEDVVIQAGPTATCEITDLGVGQIRVDDR